MPRRFLWVLLIALFATAAHARQVREDALDRQMYAIASTLRCTVCQNESIADSQADIAHDMRGLIRKQLREGRSPAQIKAYFVHRYGDYILLKPPVDRMGVIVWAAPGAFLRSRRRAGPAPPPDLDAEDRSRIQALRHRPE